MKNETFLWIAFGLLTLAFIAARTPPGAVPAPVIAAPSPAPAPASAERCLITVAPQVEVLIAPFGVSERDGAGVKLVCGDTHDVYTGRNACERARAAYCARHATVSAATCERAFDNSVADCDLGIDRALIVRRR